LYLDKPVAPSAQQILRYQGEPRDGDAVGTFVWKSHITSAASAITIPEKGRLQYVLRLHFSLWNRVDDNFDSFSATTTIYILPNFNFLIYLFHQICLHLIFTARLFPNINTSWFASEGFTRFNWRTSTKTMRQ